jgi:hypothetical protein
MDDDVADARALVSHPRSETAQLAHDAAGAVVLADELHYPGRARC